MDKKRVRDYMTSDVDTVPQTGTAREIMSHPANDYVANFIAHLNPLEVLTASDLAAPGQAEGPALPADLPLKQVLTALCGAEARPVASGGIVTRDRVLQRLSA